MIVFCGVNGVGKSTNLAKIAYWLGSQGLKVQLAACDTFRAGAVEQLKTHAAKLGGVSVELRASRCAGQGAVAYSGSALEHRMHCIGVLDGSLFCRLTALSPSRQCVGLTLHLCMA